jgi:hypothetical protein
LGYLSGKAAGKLLKVNPNISLLLLASVIPDIDILIPGVEHRGPTHSLIISVTLLIPTRLLHEKKPVPYWRARYCEDDKLASTRAIVYPPDRHYYAPEKYA